MTIYNETMAAKKTTRKSTTKAKAKKPSVKKQTNSKKTKSSRAIVRPQKGRLLAGVALAFANYFESDVTMVRILLVFLTVLLGFGPGLILYIVSWILIPSE